MGEPLSVAMAKSGCFIEKHHAALRLARAVDVRQRAGGNLLGTRLHMPPPDVDWKAVHEEYHAALAAFRELEKETDRE